MTYYLLIKMLKGEKGDAAQIPEHLMSLDSTKLKGEPGPPGYCLPSKCNITNLIVFVLEIWLIS
jgi:hypothetical protein